MDEMNPEMGMGQPESGMPTQEAGPQGYTVCIKVTPDGKFSVGVENEAAEAAPMAKPSGDGMEPAAAEASESAGYRPADSVKEALTIALEIIRADGQMPGDDMGDTEFDAGYQSR